MLDIESLKKVNDGYGHKAGYLVLAELARCIRKALRATDVCGRCGGEEFAFVLPQAPRDLARQAAERIQRAIEEPAMSDEGCEIRVTASLGLAILDAESSNLESRMDRGDKALYAAKRGGRNKVREWSVGIAAE